jgi:hypothetical protein
MPECDNCGSHVSAAFRRCFADRNGTLHACPNCETKQDIARAHQDEPKSYALGWTGQ